MFGLEGILGGLIQEPNLIIFFGLFFLFMIIAYKVVKLLIRALIVAVLAGLFPVFANMFLGMSIPITFESIIWFAMTGVEIFFVYHILVGIGQIADFLLRPFRKDKAKKVEKVIIMEKGKDKDEKKD
ncbi:MAG: hypothetical protein JSV63_01805 [Candidatus Aenigmatarchaeota archaeon]|nr:MAG: hypothetical protein JSV63_01805 [Candidatus Aenigmarchaeota archaeon]